MILNEEEQSRKFEFDEREKDEICLMDEGVYRVCSEKRNEMRGNGFD
jgi:hypothetical protein